MRLCIVIAIAGALLFAAGSSAATRKWTDITGTFSVEAELIEIKDDAVVLKKTDGSTKTVPISRLSQLDRNYLESLDKPGPTPPVGKPLAADTSPPQRFPAWIKDPAEMIAPNAEVFGSIHGRPFSPDDVELDGGTITIRQSSNPGSASSLTVYLFLKAGETLASRTYKMPAAEQLRAPIVQIGWSEAGSPLEKNETKKAETYFGGYAMMLKFGESRGGQLQGEIYVCLPDSQRSVVAGKFTVSINGRRP